MVLAVTAALLLGGCGDDATTPPPTTGASSSTATVPSPGAPPADPTRFLGTVDAVCIQHARDVRDLTRELGAPEAFADRAPHDARRAQTVRDQADRLQALHPPPSLRERFLPFLDAATAYADAFEASARAAAAGDEAAWQPTVRAHLDRGGALIAAAVELGLRACSRRPSASVAAAVRSTTERVLLGRDPARSCARDVTRAFLRSNLSGSRRSCLEVLRGLTADGATVTFVEEAGVRGVTGVDGVIASANVRFSTRRGRPAKRLVYDLVREDGRWLLDSAFEPPTTEDDEPHAAS